MIQLTKDIIAVEVPKIIIGHIWIGKNLAGGTFLYGVTSQGIYDIWMIDKGSTLIGVTPLSEEQWKEVVLHEVFGNFFDYVNPNSGDYARGYMCQSATESGLSLLESKGLDVNKKYAIIKMEK